MTPKSQVQPLNNEEKISPVLLLQELSQSEVDGYLQVNHNSINWFIYFSQGKITYASHSLDPFHRLERHLRRLSTKVRTLSREDIAQVRVKSELKEPIDLFERPDYKEIFGLVEENKIKEQDAVELIKKIIQEVLFSFLLLPKINYHFIYDYDGLPRFCLLQVEKILEECIQEIQAWHNLNSKIWSPHQRPYLFHNPSSKYQFPPEKQEQLSKILKGFSFHELASLLNQDELRLARKFENLIQEGIIFLRPPQRPFDQLPNLSNSSLEFLEPFLSNSPDAVEHDLTLSGIKNANFSGKKYKIVCIDDSKTMLNEMKKYLEDEVIEVFKIYDSVKALKEVIKVKPDLILLDISMPMVDGYQLCRLIRGYPPSKEIPIIMVTGNTGLVDRARAKLAGATDYMTKPFSQADLLKMVFRYLT